MTQPNNTGEIKCRPKEGNCAHCGDCGYLGQICDCKICHTSEREGKWKFPKLQRKDYPKCPLCGYEVVAAHMTSDDSRIIHCFSASCEYRVHFNQLITPITDA